MNNISIVSEQCTACSACAAVCPRHAIQMAADENGFYQPKIDAAKCTDCGACLKKCHVLEKNPGIAEFADVRKYCGYTLDESDRRRSSSGGIFTQIAKTYKDSVVIGAAYLNEEKIVRHIAGDLSQLRKSKYVESYVGDSAALIRQGLKQDKTVIFCGTPCQVAGMRKLFGDAENLILIDFVCHGVPSMKLLNEHMALIEMQQGKEIDYVNFRDKRDGWTNSTHGIRYYFTDGSNLHQGTKQDTYSFAFINNRALRSSCYDCQYVCKSCADITLADFWGVYKYDASLNDEKGISLLFLNTAKGTSVFEQIQSGIFCKEIANEDIEYIFKGHKLQGYKENRDAFFAEYQKVGFEKAIRKDFLKSTFKFRMKQKIKSLIK